ncbi:ATP-binding protein [Hymenobacter radiodurans]|uniref:ATP-binding protein n=1 Tax=Hymenobacter radiodurans TaxID=2496028 RepID=UPI00196BA133|nr:ATP-binding protein [Hymenobacter radiodurans]
MAQTQLSEVELLYLMIALAPHLQPGFFDALIRDCLPDGGELPEFGGVRGANHRGLLPTGETALYILAGNDLEKRLALYDLFNPKHFFAREHIIALEDPKPGEPHLSGRLIPDSEVMELLITGTVSPPRFSMEFPAEHIRTEMEWDDLVLHPNTLQQIQEIRHWITHSETLLHKWGMRKKIKPGFRALFYGPPGTGKTLTASLLGKSTNKDVFRIDLSRVVSKYIGETEKNLATLFAKAENKDWILFFDEADALFGKRTDIRDAHDKYANQEVAYLLQRIESYNGLIILATNQRGNIDDAFVRRFQTIIHFPMPRVEERHRIWRSTFPPQLQIADDINWLQVAARYELTGAGILNVAHYCAIEALADKSNLLTLQHLEKGILREYAKEGKVV